MNTYECKQKVLAYYDSSVYEHYVDNGINLIEINTEDGYCFYAIDYDSSNYGRDLDYYYNEEGAYEKIIDLIREGNSINNVEDASIDWEELYEEVREEELSDINKEIRIEVLALIKPIAKSFLEDRIFTEKYGELIDPKDPHSEDVTKQQNDYVNLLLNELKFSNK